MPRPCRALAAAAAFCAAALASEEAAGHSAAVGLAALLRDLASLYAGDPALPAFSAFATEAGREYSGADVGARFAAFKASAALVEAHNDRNGSFQLALNQFADMTQEEFAQTHVGLSAPQNATSWGGLQLLGTGADVEVALEATGRDVNWVSSLPPVQDQHACGSCWAFASTATISAAWKLATGRLEVLSDQQLIDCSVMFGNLGCTGGNMNNAYAYARGAPICTAASYPFHGSMGQCRDSSCQVAIPRGGVAGFRVVPPNSEGALMAAVSRQPVAAGMEAGKSSVLRLYSSGILSGGCGVKPDHAVVVVGYGALGGRPFWLIRNSWGPGWGEGGYFKLARGPGPTGSGECGIMSIPSFPVVNPQVRAGHNRRLLGRTAESEPDLFA